LKPILIFGSGFLGSTLYHCLKSSNFDVRLASRTCGHPHVVCIDLLDYSAVKECIKILDPSIIINTAGLASYFRCESNQQLSYALNFKINEIITRVIENTGKKLIFFSSSYIFSGVTGGYSEEDTEYSTSVYSIHKRIAEKLIKSRLENFLIIRLETLFGEVGKGKWRIGSTLLSGEIRVVNMMLRRQPISSLDAAIVIKNLIEVSANGVYNVAGEHTIEYSQLLNFLRLRSASPFRIVYDDKGDWIIMPPRDTTLSLKKIRDLGIPMPIYSFNENRT
jgi:dTDP-4-dehydrorhamnose reductase